MTQIDAKGRPITYWGGKAMTQNNTEQAELVALIDAALKDCPREISKPEGFFTRWLPNPAFTALTAARAALAAAQGGQAVAPEVAALVDAARNVTKWVVARDYAANEYVDILLNRLQPFSGVKTDDI